MACAYPYSVFALQLCERKSDLRKFATKRSRPSSGPTGSSIWFSFAQSRYLAILNLCVSCPLLVLDLDISWSSRYSTAPRAALDSAGKNDKLLDLDISV